MISPGSCSLRRKLSQLGPERRTDLNGDGREDLVLGSGRGGMVSVYTNAGGGTFGGWTIPCCSDR